MKRELSTVFMTRESVSKGNPHIAVRIGTYANMWGAETHGVVELKREQLPAHIRAELIRVWQMIEKEVAVNDDHAR